MYKLGIIGFGVVGKSALALLSSTRVEGTSNRVECVLSESKKISVWDNRVLDEHEVTLLKHADAVFIDGHSTDLKNFFEQHDILLASPGVDLSPYQQYRSKILCELDFFSVLFNKPTIAITGSVGKTTITRLLGSLANIVPKKGNGRRLQVAIGGNVGIGMLDLVSQQKELDAAVIELSSFQLELNTSFSPNIAIYTNFYPNHLDRHKTFAGYCAAKLTMLYAQGPQDTAIISYELLVGQAQFIMASTFKSVRSKILVTAVSKLDDTALKLVPISHFQLLYIDGTSIMLATYEYFNCTATILLVENIILPDLTFISNWMQVVAGLYVMGLAVEQLPAVLKKISQEKLLSDLGHRVRHCATIRGVDFYDDSKSTIAEATLAAVARLTTKKRPLIIILGGLSKGIDRSWLMPELAKMHPVKHIFAFGPESHQFPGATACNTLEEVIQVIGLIMKDGDIVIFSPSGTSFDFFKNYEHRGKVFEQLVQKLA